jgi:hypothetical protein
MRRVLACCIVFILVTSATSHGVAISSPPMRKRVVGSWEAVGEDDFRVFKMEIASQDAESVIAMTAGRVNSVTLLFKAKRIDVRDDRFELDATGADGPDNLRIRGKVKRIGVMSSEGAIDAKVMLVDESSRQINSWHVTFLNYGGDYLRRLCQLSADATVKIQEAKKAAASPSRPSGH